MNRSSTLQMTIEMIEDFRAPEWNCLRNFVISELSIFVNLTHGILQPRTISVSKRIDDAGITSTVVTVQVQAMDGEEGGARKGRGEASRNKQGVP